MDKLPAYEAISVFDMLKVGIGPSSSHTLGPWRAAERFVGKLTQTGLLPRVGRVVSELYGSLALTGAGHGTDKALLLGLSGLDPETMPLEDVLRLPEQARKAGELRLAGHHPVPFREESDLIYHYDRVLAHHANGLKFHAYDAMGDSLCSATYFSIGGGFVVEEGQPASAEAVHLPCPIVSARQLGQYCADRSSPIWKVVLENEKAWRPEKEVFARLGHIWKVMADAVYRGCHTEGELPGGLKVKRRASGIARRLLGPGSHPSFEAWIEEIQNGSFSFPTITKWIGCFAMAVNEENASFGRIVTAPTNGAAGVIPAVIMYYLCFTDEQPGARDIAKFLLTAGELGSLFKKGATISAAMGGCQAEIGVSSAMAAAALTERLGGTVPQALMAAEIAMEHHLGLTCDPVQGLVQVPCIERNSMGAVKAITATHLALESDPEAARVSLDDVIKTMWETARDMNTKYKETSQGGLAANISIKVPEC